MQLPHPLHPAHRQVWAVALPLEHSPRAPVCSTGSGQSWGQHLPAEKRDLFLLLGGFPLPRLPATLSVCPGPGAKDSSNPSIVAMHIHAIYGLLVPSCLSNTLPGAGIQ